MPSPTSSAEFLDLVQKSGLVEEKRLAAYADKLRADNALPADPKELAAQTVRDGILTHFQAEQILQGKWRRFHIRKDKVLERLGARAQGPGFPFGHKPCPPRLAPHVLPTPHTPHPPHLAP